MAKYIIYDIKLEENIKLATSNMQVDAHDSMSYISGSAVRGAYIYKYIRAHNIRNINTGSHREKLLAGGIKFLNAYPSYMGRRSLPLAKCYFAPKQAIKTFEGSMDIFLGLDKDLPPGYEKFRLSEFVNTDGNKLTRVRVEKTSNLHINKRTEKNKLFRYESIKKGQTFSGIIRLERDEYADEVLDLLSDQVVYIGGSKGSGYGRCLIQNMQVVDQNPETKDYIIDEASDCIYITALSDIIYRSDYGTYQTIIEEKFLEDALGLEGVEYVDSSIDTNNITNFNNKWRARTPNTTAIKAGSIFKYRLVGSLDIGKIRDFIDRGLGERRAEGFGRIAISTQIDDAIFYNSDQTIKNSKKDICLEEYEKDLINLIGTRVYKARVDNKINAVVLDLNRHLEGTKILKQWGTLKDFFLYLSRLDIEEGKKVYEKYMDHIVKKRGKSFKDMERVYFNTACDKRQNLIEYFNDCMDVITDKNHFAAIYEDCRVDIINGDNTADDGLIYRTNLKVLSELCRFQIRKEDL